MKNIKVLKYFLSLLLFLINIFGLTMILLVRFTPLRRDVFICSSLPFFLRLLALIFFIFSFIKFKKLKIAYILSITALILLIISGSLAGSIVCRLE